MFDFIKTNINYLPVNYYDNNPLLDFETTVNSNGEIITRIAEYQNLKFKITHEKYIDINGSIHYYFNGGKHNHNNFSIPNVLDTIIELNNTFDINPILTPLHNLEFGVNIITEQRVNSLLNSIISYKGKEPRIEPHKGKGKLIRFEFDHYELKIYNKGAQFKLDENVLRFEIKVRKMEYFKQRNINIKLLSDLLNPRIYPKLLKYLLKTFDDLVIYDKSINIRYISERDTINIINGRNPKYWIGLKKGNELKVKRKRFRELVIKHGNNIQSELRSKIEQKWNELSRTDNETIKKTNDFLLRLDNKKYPKITDFATTKLSTAITQNNTSNIELKQYPKQRYCITCGREITGQRKGSIFCSEKVFGKDAKRCRNERSNRTNNYKRKEERLYTGVLLFNVESLRLEL